MNLYTLYQPAINDFTQFQLTPEQEHQGSIFNPLQEAVLQNELALLATKKVDTAFSAQYPNEIPELDGQIAYLKFLLGRSREKMALASPLDISSTEPQEEELYGTTNIFDLP